MTLAARVIACLDVDAGRVVKGVNFVDLVDAGDPIELAAAYGKAGIDELVFLDITASSSDRETTLELVRRIASGRVSLGHPHRSGRLFAADGCGRVLYQGIRWGMGNCP